jgi:hypothetical protein
VIGVGEMCMAVREVVPLLNYRLLLTFENNEKRIFDSIEWVNHADIDPEVLYEDSYAYE